MLNKRYVDSAKFNRLYIIPVIAVLCIGGVIIADNTDTTDQATGTWTSGDCTCTLTEDGVFTVTGNGAMADYAVPGSRPLWYGYDIFSIIIGDSVTSIGNYAFQDCWDLKSVTIGNSVTSIGQNAFQYCDTLPSVTIPDSVTSIGQSAFRNCIFLESVTIGNSVTTIGGGAFNLCKALTSVTIPDSVTTMGEGVFQNCYALESIELGNGLTTIPKRICDGCSALASITFGSNVTTIDQGAFYFCTALTSVTIPDTVTSINSNAFYNCSSLTSLDLGNGLVNLGPETFRDCSALTMVTIPNSVTNIGQQAFQNCTALTEVEIGTGVERIGNQVFENCPDVAVIVFQATGWNITAIGTNAFGLGTADHPTTAIVYSRENVARDMLNGYTNDHTVIYYHNLPNITVTITVNNEEYGSVNISKVLVERGTLIGLEGNILHIGTFDVVATANQPTAQYTFEFGGWTGIPIDGRAVQDLTITANFRATINQYDVTITVNDATYGSVDVASVRVDYGTLITQEGNVMNIGDTVITATATPQTVGWRYVFANWDGLTDAVTGDMTITAVFNAIQTAIVTYHGNGGQPETQTETVDVGTVAHLSDYTCTRDAYEFLGWNTDPSAILPVSEYIVNADSDLYAVWKVSIDVTEYYGDTEHHITDTVEDDSITTMIIRLIPIFIALQLISSMQVLFVRRTGLIE